MNKLTLLLILLASFLVLLLANVVVRDSRPPTLASGSERGELLKDFKPDEITKITLKRGDVEIEFDKKDKDWVMPSQKGRAAKTELITRFMDDVRDAYSSGPRNARDLATFDLSPSKRVEVTFEGGLKKTLLYLGKNLPESGSFVQRDSSGPVLEIDKYLPTHAGVREEKSVTILDPAFFYDMKIFADSADDAIDIAIKKGNEVFRVQKVLPGKGPVTANQKLDKDDKPEWWVTEPEGAPADDAKIRNVCSTVLNLNGKSYADDIPEKDRGFDKPAAKILIRLKDGATRELTFGKIEGDDVLVSAAGKPDAFKVAKYVFETCTKTDEMRKKDEKKEEPDKKEPPKPAPIVIPPKPNEPKPPVLPAPK